MGWKKLLRILFSDTPTLHRNQNSQQQMIFIISTYLHQVCVVHFVGIRWSRWSLSWSHRKVTISNNENIKISRLERANRPLPITNSAAPPAQRTIYIQHRPASALLVDFLFRLRVPYSCCVGATIIVLIDSELKLSWMFEDGPVHIRCIVFKKTKDDFFVMS